MVIKHGECHGQLSIKNVVSERYSPYCRHGAHHTHQSATAPAPHYHFWLQHSMGCYLPGEGEHADQVTDPKKQGET